MANEGLTVSYKASAWCSSLRPDPRLPEDRGPARIQTPATYVWSDPWVPRPHQGHLGALRIASEPNQV